MGKSLTLDVRASRKKSDGPRISSRCCRPNMVICAGYGKENFPFPEADPRSTITTLEDAGESLYAARADLMQTREQGLTTTYNQLKDPDCSDDAIVALRQAHLDLDRAVLDAYDWGDLEVPPYEEPRTPAERDALEAFQDEILDRLFALNAERARA